MRRFLLVLVLAGVAPADGNPLAEETAALLLSPDAAKRAAAAARLDGQPPAFVAAVVAHVARHGYDAEAWLEELQARAPDAGPAERKRIEALVEHLSPFPRTMVSVRLHCAAVPEAVAKRVAPAPLSVYPDDANLERCAAILRGAEGAFTHLSRELPVTDRWTARAESVRKVSYVRDVGPKGGPVVDHVRPGAELDVRPALSRGKEHVTLTVRLRLARLERPIRVVEKKLPSGLTGRVQVPRLTETVVARTVTVPVGGHCVLRVPGVVLLLRAAPAPARIEFPPEDKPTASGSR